MVASALLALAVMITGSDSLDTPGGRDTTIAAFVASADSIGAESSGGEMRSADTAAVLDSAGVGTTVSMPGVLDMFTNIPGDIWRWGGESLRVENIPMIAGIAVVTTALVLTDDVTLAPLKKEYESSPRFHQLSDWSVFVGDGKFQFGIAGLFAAYGFIAADQRAIRTASQTVEVILSCGAVVQLLKHLTGRESPFVATTPTGRWRLLPNQAEYAKHVPHYDAYPSGHVATALATLTVIAENYPEVPAIRYLGYPVIGMLAVGMVASGIHWWSDYPLSIALGYGFGRIVSHAAAPEAGTSSLLRSGEPRFGMTLLPDGTPAASITIVW